jgi:plastocyanin
MRQWRWIAVPAVLFAISACGGSGGGSDAGVTGPTGGSTNPGGGSTNPNEVTLMSSLSFSPATLTVAKGSTVTWTWQACDPTGGGSYGYGSACISHQVVFDDGSNLQSPTQDQGSFTHVFATAGTFKYHCSVHGAAVMSGQIVVQ